MDTAIAIRTAVVKDGMLYAQAGAGIVHDSVPESEWTETREQGARDLPRGGHGAARPDATDMNAMLLLIDNYDSFTYNLVQYFGELGADVRRPSQRRADAATQIAAWAPEQIVISPGPCTPTEAGISVPLIERFAGKIPILGVCLGHQAIGQAFGARIVRAEARDARQGVAGDSTTGAASSPAFPSPLTATRYHSLAIERGDAPRVPRRHRRRPTTARSWACGIASGRSRASSSTLRRSSPSTATRCCATFSKAPIARRRHDELVPPTQETT